MVGAIGSNVFTLKHTHVRAHEIVVTVAVGGCAAEITQGGKPSEICDAAQLHIRALKPERNRTWGEDVDPRC
jgi:uncharacterized protein YjlB